MRGDTVAPIYFLCDESGSMDANGGIDAINSALQEMHAAIAGDPLVSDKFRIGLLTFSDIAEELLPLSKMSDVVSMPGCVAKMLSNYGEAFNFLEGVISRDIESIKNQGLQPFRPMVFFVSDGRPTDNWQLSYVDTVSKKNSNWPHLIYIISEGSEDVRNRFSDDKSGIFIDLPGFLGLSDVILQILRRLL
jgi:uncharacterized protein YegL